jgi:hypothetical protein
MQNLSIKHKTHIVLRRIVGAVGIVCGVLYIIISISEPRALNIILGVFWTLFGIAYFIPALARSDSSVIIGEGFIKVRWLNWLRSIAIQDSEIEKIIISRLGIRINRKEKKPIILPIDFFELDQKKTAYSYFIELSVQKNIPIERSDRGFD